ncbi:UDP-N-acetylglucosamine--undecaprenyl-phosphate N-acetylglucosaminephosphotransferase [Aeromonas veronii]|uniref:UDP-N-acetylglucosamine--undecaprenyl-phosphate N-acetylglucosaminephosphotransferase n=1 Tax=Aeromonas veronii TaxID=654 RepID=UPI0015DC71A6|nr:UDP-N-acetylglucosamine--undecaprenyl-phosphate N-acetylglucosaminephosphotransferase [Aeromonas veronii]BBU03903.1 undecaprenyl-phosphate alpha-N-acetylglucosaminyl 1-phosphate transferase [Aeromonas veronii]
MEMSGLIAFLGTAMAIMFLRPIAGKLQLVDLPNQRKQHVGAIPLIGGLAVSIGVYLSVFITMPLSLTLVMLLLCAGAIVVIGAVDDALDISPRLRLGLQALLIVVLCLSTGVGLHHFGDVVGVGDIHLPWGEVFVAVLAVCAAVNAFNMMDGIDGLAGSMAGISLVGLATLFGNTMPDMANFCLVIAIALVPYLAINLTIPPFKRKIFMGDAGSMFLGFIIGFLVIYGSQVTEQRPAFRPVMALWLMGLPLIDMVGIMIRRIRKGQSPLKADRNHLHHILLHAGFTHREALLLMVVTNLGIVFMGILAEMAKLPEWLMMVIYLGLFTGYTLSLNYAWRVGRWIKSSKNQVSNNSN